MFDEERLFSLGAEGEDLQLDVDDLIEEEDLSIYYKLTRDMDNFIKTFEDTLESKQIKYYKDYSTYGIEKASEYYRGYGKNNSKSEDIPLIYLYIKKYRDWGYNKELLSEQILVLTNGGLNELYKNQLGSYIPKSTYGENKFSASDESGRKYLYEISKKETNLLDMQACYENDKFKSLYQLSKAVKLFIEMIVLTNDDNKELKDYFELIRYIYKSNDILLFELNQGWYNKYIVDAGIVIDIENGNNFNDELQRLKSVLEKNGFQLKKINKRYSL